MKKTRTYTRKGYALRLLSILLVIILIGHVTGTYFITPYQALDQLVKKEAVGDVEVITPLYDADLTPSPIMRYYLCANDDVLMLCGTRFHPLMGWYYEHTAEVPLAGDDPVKVAYQSFSRKGEDEKIYVFGRVEDDDIAVVDIEARYYYDDIAGTRSINAQIGEVEFIRHGNYRYFVKELNLLVRPEISYPQTDYHYSGIFVSAEYIGGEPVSFVSEIKAEGETEFSRRIDHYSYTSFG